MKDITVFSYKFRPAVLVAIVLVAWFVIANVLFSTMKVSFSEGLRNTKEGFSSGWMSVPLFSKAKSLDYITPPSTWDAQPISISASGVPTPAAAAILDRPAQPLPLKDGQMLMFADTEFKPECCPNTYSSSSGCACMTMGQYDYLRDGGGNTATRGF
jgi:hypothetical protein